LRYYWVLGQECIFGPFVEHARRYRDTAIEIDDRQQWCFRHEVSPDLRARIEVIIAIHHALEHDHCILISDIGSVSYLD